MMSRIVSATISYALSLKEVRQLLACTVFNLWKKKKKKGRGHLAYGFGMMDKAN